jgi:hypothetical protein
MLHGQPRGETIPKEQMRHLRLMTTLKNPLEQRTGKTVNTGGKPDGHVTFDITLTPQMHSRQWYLGRQTTR